MNSYAKLRDGTWGVRIEGTAKPGDVVKVTTKAGVEKQETVKAVVWSDKGVSLCSIEPRARDRAPSDRTQYAGGRARGYKCVTGGDCSSFGNGKNCGGAGCDGW